MGGFSTHALWSSLPGPALVMGLPGLSWERLLRPDPASLSLASGACPREVRRGESMPGPASGARVCVQGHAWGQGDPRSPRSNPQGVIGCQSGPTGVTGPAMAGTPPSGVHTARTFHSVIATAASVSVLAGGPAHPWRALLALRQVAGAMDGHPALESSSVVSGAESPGGGETSCHSLEPCRSSQVRQVPGRAPDSTH